MKAIPGGDQHLWVASHRHRIDVEKLRISRQAQPSRKELDPINRRDRSADRLKKCEKCQPDPCCALDRGVEIERREGNEEEYEEVAKLSERIAYRSIVVEMISSRSGSLTPKRAARVRSAERETGPR